MSKIKEEIERLLKSKFIRTTRYVEWLTNMVLTFNKNETLGVYINLKEVFHIFQRFQCNYPKR